VQGNLMDYYEHCNRGTSTDADLGKTIATALGKAESYAIRQTI